MKQPNKSIYSSLPPNTKYAFPVVCLCNGTLILVIYCYLSVQFCSNTGNIFLIGNVYFTISTPVRFEVSNNTTYLTYSLNTVRFVLLMTGETSE
mgnify:FL=1